MGEIALVRERDGVAHLEINRPEARNALTTQMTAALAEHVVALENNPDVHVIVVSGAGDKAFSAGYDINEMSDFDEAQSLLNYIKRQPMLWAIANCAKPTIGAINGFAHGAGAIIAAALDMRIGCPATEFRFTAAAYGGVNNTWQLPRVVGLARALEYVLSARPIRGQEALSAGLLNHLAESPAACIEQSLELAARIARHPSAAIQLSRQLIHACESRDLQAAYQAENDVMNTQLRPGRPAEIFDQFLHRKPGNPSVD